MTKSWAAFCCPGTYKNIYQLCCGIKGKIAYAHYDNYDAIEVPFTDAIPSDYDGVMGVPISFLIKYCPEQFEILGITDRGNK